ncbi:Nucleotide-binding universal stress protein, UspA family [Blastococcus aggregatus]|uniref:Nucleotide-binding universal stress protein, UspA family n=1 Tax=Blastococcus aggregatus TaxID=38502 RepID=A0A285VAR2_9ACTN|nr:universal stress protein [Blastococcus aggregatus]SOC49581.1 Nucleotide-binding universal stress protein, UspA family [Blastococcus aggregatus]
MEHAGNSTSTPPSGAPSIGDSPLDLPPGAVVVAFDGSVPAREAAHWAAREVAGAERPLRLLHALHWPRHELADLDLPASALDVDRMARAATTTMALAVDRCRRETPGTDVEGEVVLGNAVEVLRKAAADAALLVLGASGQTDTPQVLLGSSADELLRTAGAPVVVVRDRPTRAPGPVVIGVDGSPASERAVAFGFELAAARGHDVVAVHTWSDIPLAALSGLVDLDRDELAERAAAFLSARIGEAERRHRDVRVHTATAADHPARALLDHAAGAALLVVGRHGRARSGAPMGSVCHAVAHYARCPVAVVGPA